MAWVERGGLGLGLGSPSHLRDDGQVCLALHVRVKKDAREQPGTEGPLDGGGAVHHARTGQQPAFLPPVCVEDEVAHLALCGAESRQRWSDRTLRTFTAQRSQCTCRAAVHARTMPSPVQMLEVIV